MQCGRGRKGSWKNKMKTVEKHLKSICKFKLLDDGWYEMAGISSQPASIAAADDDGW